MLSLEYQLSENGEHFLLFGSSHGDDDRLLIFATDQAVQLFVNLKSGIAVRHLASLHHQLCAIHVRNNNRTIPCVYGLMD